MLAIYQWIRLDKLWKSFFLISNYWPKTEKYSTHNKVGFMQAILGRHLCCLYLCCLFVLVYYLLVFDFSHSTLNRNFIHAGQSRVCAIITNVTKILYNWTVYFISVDFYKNVYQSTSFTTFLWANTGLVLQWFRFLKLILTRGLDKTCRSTLKKGYLF